MYSEKLNTLFEKNGIEIGDKISVEKNGKKYEGILMPRTFHNPDTIVIKLDNGYNIGIKWDENVKIKLVSKHEKKEEKPLRGKSKANGKNAISILLTGGTIASKVDYRTGGVTPVVSANELIEAIPELKNIAEINARTIMQVFSENINFEHYEKMVKEVKREIEKRCEGIIIAHGTDTMHYSSAALSFALQNLNLPVIFVGAQRSSDRGSSDAAINLISSCIFAKENAAGVFVCMHETISDESCGIHLGTRVRKMHTSRRDAFKTVNTKPVAKVFWREKKVEWISRDWVGERSKDKEVKIFPKFERKVALIKIHPGFNPEIIDFLLDKKYKGIVIEGTGLGHAPEYAFASIKRACEQAVVCMTSQCIFGRINMNVYSTGRDLLKFGVIPCEMLPEVAFIKLSWALGNFKEEEVKEIMQKNIAGEIVERIL